MLKICKNILSVIAQIRKCILSLKSTGVVSIQMGQEHATMKENEFLRHSRMLTRSRLFAVIFSPRSMHCIAAAYCYRCSTYHDQCWYHGCTVQKRLNWSRCSLVGWFMCAQGTMWGRKSHRYGQFLEGFPAHEETLGDCCSACSQRGSFSGQKWHESETAAVDCNAPDWLMSRYIIPLRMNEWFILYWSNKLDWNKDTICRHSTKCPIKYIKH